MGPLVWAFGRCGARSSTEAFFKDKSSTQDAFSLTSE